MSSSHVTLRTVNNDDYNHMQGLDFQPAQVWQWGDEGQGATRGYKGLGGEGEQCTTDHRASLTWPWPCHLAVH